MVSSISFSVLRTPVIEPNSQKNKKGAIVTSRAMSFFFHVEVVLI